MEGPSDAKEFMISRATMKIRDLDAFQLERRMEVDAVMDFILDKYCIFMGNGSS